MNGTRSTPEECAPSAFTSALIPSAYPVADGRRTQIGINVETTGEVVVLELWLITCG